MASKVKFNFIGKDREFKKLRMKKLNQYAKEMQEEMKAANELPPVEKDDARLLAVGTYVSKMLVDFNPEEIFEAEQDEFMIAQALNLLQPYFKGGRTETQIEALKNDIIDASTAAGINAIMNGFRGIGI